MGWVVEVEEVEVEMCVCVCVCVCVCEFASAELPKVYRACSSILKYSQ